jgi:hypothetical protein
LDYMYACFTTFFFSFICWELQAPRLAQGMNFTFHAGGGSKWPQTPA